MVAVEASNDASTTPRIVRVTRDGAEVGWSALTKALISVGPDGFIALDTEFTGWGGDPRLSAGDLQERYKAVAMVASTRALVSLGVSIFDPVDNEDGEDHEEDDKKDEVEDGGEEVKRTEVRKRPKTSEGEVNGSNDSGKRKYKVAAFDVLLACDDDFVISPAAASFLLSHGLDLNEMFTNGVRYRRACSDTKKKVPVTNNSNVLKQSKDQSEELSRKSEKKRKRFMHRKHKTGEDETAGNGKTDFEWAPMPRGLLWRIGLAQVPVVVHNGFFDLTFLYAAFHSRMPDTLQQFCEQLLDIFPAGIYDTKHLAERIADEKASYLSYVFAKARRKFGHKLTIEAAEDLPPASATNPHHPEKITMDMESVPLCQVFAVRGFCKKQKTCPLSHSIQRVLDQEEKGELPEAKDTKALFKTNAKLIQKLNETRPASDEKIKLPKKRKRALELDARAVEVDATNAHSAGFDSYCTGYIFASYVERLPADKLEAARNNVYLIQKRLPLLLHKSNFTANE